MADLKRTYRWERYTPDLGDNREQPEGQRLELDVASALTGEQLAQYDAAVRDAFEAAKQTPVELPALLAAAFAPYVRLVGSHTVEGKPVTNLGEYLGVVTSLSGVYNLRELAQVVRDFNSVGGTGELFSQRHSGGLRTTRAGSAAPQTGGR